MIFQRFHDSRFEQFRAVPPPCVPAKPSPKTTGKTIVVKNIPSLYNFNIKWKKLIIIMQIE